MFFNSISTSNHAFERAIWDKLPECILNHEGDLSQKLPEPIMWLLLIAPNQQTFCTETNIFQQRAITTHRAGYYEAAGNYKIMPLTLQCQLQSILWLKKEIK